MDIKDLDQRFLKINHSKSLFMAWNLIKRAHRKIAYIIVEIGSGEYILIRFKELRNAIKKLPEEQLRALTLDTLVEGHPKQKAYEFNRYGNGERDFLMDISPTKRVLFKNQQRMIGILVQADKAYEAEQEAVKPSSVPGRYANLWFTEQRAPETQIKEDQALILNQEIFLLFYIGPYDIHTILEEAEPFPDQEVIEAAHPEIAGQSIPLDVTFFSQDLDISKDNCTQRLHLEQNRPSEICYFPLTPNKVGVAKGRVCVFYKNHLLQALNIHASVAIDRRTADQPQVAHIEMTFSADFKNSESFSERGLWLGINRNTDGSHILNIKESENAMSCYQGDIQIKRALEQARRALMDVSFELKRDYDGRLITDETTGQYIKDYRFNPDHSPRGNPSKRFIEDLTRLADVGSQLFSAVFGTPPPAEERELVENSRKMVLKVLEKPSVIQVCRLKKMGDIWPWAVMYDLDLDIDHVSEVCEQFHQNGNIVPYENCIRDCPHRDAEKVHMKARNVICPYGFWGFKHIIEQPVQPGGNKAISDLALEIKLTDTPVFQMPVETSLQNTEPTHITNMRLMKFSVLDSRQEILEAFDSTTQPTPPEPQIVYFFCHGGYDVNQNPLLGVGNREKLRPKDLNGKLDWQQSNGLVFINGCHTVELSPDDLAAIMSPFVNGGAGGIIGTEITVHTWLACPFAEIFFTRFLSNAAQDKNKVGEIIRDIRLVLLAKKNPLGLVYTPYCSADLHIG